MAYSDGDYYLYQRTLLSSVGNIAKRIIPLTSPVDEELVPQMRLEQSTYTLTRESARTMAAVVTAHNLAEYVSVFYTLRVEDNEYSWLHELVKNTFGQE